MTTTEEQLENWSIFLDQGCYNPNLATGAESFPYCLTAVVLLNVPDSLPSSNLVLIVQSLQGEIFIDQVTGEIYIIYDYANRLFISSGER